MAGSTSRQTEVKLPDNHHTRRACCHKGPCSSEAESRAGHEHIHNFCVALCAGGSIELAGLLLEEAPGSVEVADSLQALPLHRALDADRGKVAALLLNTAPATVRALCRGALPIHIAAKRCSVGVVWMLLDAAPDTAAALDCRPHGLHQGGTPLHYAVARRPGGPGSLAVVRLLLLAAPESARVADARGQVPLHGAAAGEASSSLFARP